MELGFGLRKYCRGKVHSEEVRCRFVVVEITANCPQDQKLREKPREKKVFCLALCAMLFALSCSASAQQPKKVPLIGYLSTIDAARDSARAEAIRLALRDRGHIEGQNIATEYRYAEGKVDRYHELAADALFSTQIVAKYTKVEDRELNTHAIESESKAMERTLQVDPKGIELILQLIGKTVPQAASARAEDFYDARFYTELRDSGFLKRLWGEKP